VSQFCDKKKYFEKIVTDLWQKKLFDKNCHKKKVWVEGFV